MIFDKLISPSVARWGLACAGWIHPVCCLCPLLRTRYELGADHQRPGSWFRQLRRPLVVASWLIHRRGQLWLLAGSCLSAAVPTAPYQQVRVVEVQYKGCPSLRLLYPYLFFLFCCRRSYTGELTIHILTLNVNTIFRLNYMGFNLTFLLFENILLIEFSESLYLLKIKMHSVWKIKLLKEQLGIFIFYYVDLFLTLLLLLW